MSTLQFISFLYNKNVLLRKITFLFIVMAELLFECYNIPSIAYGVDCLFSYQHNNCPSDGLIVSIGYQATHIIPILDGKADVASAKRINLGGFHITSYMHRLLQLKYPVHVNAITPSRAEVIILYITYIITCILISSWVL